MNLDYLKDEHIWAQKYRPKLIDECILPDTLKSKMKEYVNSGKLPSFLFYGTNGGMGKTTLAMALCNEVGVDVMFINSSLESGIDTLRDKIKSFASKTSLSGSYKVVILDEVDYSNAQSFQPALRGMMEEFSNNCSFILTCNYKNRLLPQIISRCTQVHFKVEQEDKQKLMEQFLKRVFYILETEKIKYDGKVVAKLIAKNFPDFRQTLNILQDYSVSGIIDSGILVNISEDIFKELFTNIKSKKFTEIRKWVASNSDIEPNMLFSHLYKYGNEIIVDQSIPQMILILADYQHKASMVVDQQINTMACLVEIMHSCKFKE